MDRDEYKAILKTMQNELQYEFSKKPSTFCQKKYEVVTKALKDLEQGIDVVTCRNCKYWIKDSRPHVPDSREFHFCPMIDFNTAEDFYCADGKRKGNV